MALRGFVIALLVTVGYECSWGMGEGETVRGKPSETQQRARMADVVLATGLAEENLVVGYYLVKITGPRDLLKDR